MRARLSRRRRYKARNDEFYQDYLAGKLDNDAYLNFCLEVLGRTEMATLDEWHLDYMRDCIEPIVLPKAIELLAKHREAGDKLVIITATNRFVTGPIAQRLGVETLIATECEMVGWPLHRAQHRRPMLPGREGDTAESLAGRERAFAGRQLLLQRLDE